MRNRWLIGWMSMILVSQALAQATNPTPQQRFLEKVAPSIVAVEVVVRYEIHAGDDSSSGEQKQTLTGTVLTEDGVILVPSIPFSSEWLKQLFGEREGVQMNLSPQSFKVTFAGDSKQYEAELLATDSQLGLGFIKLKERAERALLPVRFRDTLPSVGDELWSLRRKGKSFDYAPYYERVLLTGTITKPRRAFITATTANFGLEPGTLLFTPEGEAVGVLIPIVDPSPQEDESGSMFGGRTSSLFGTYLLSYADLKPILEKALTRKSEGGAQ